MLLLYIDVADIEVGQFSQLNHRSFRASNGCDCPVVWLSLEMYSSDFLIYLKCLLILCFSVFQGFALSGWVQQICPDVKAMKILDFAKINKYTCLHLYFESCLITA